MKRIALVLVGLATTAGVVRAATYTVDPVHSGVEFKVRHLVTKVSGQFNDFSGTIVAEFDDLDASSVEFVINAASIDTDSEDRDKHLRSEDFFDVASHPEITFTSSKITKAGDNEYAVTGTLTMHGVSKTVTLPVTFLGEAPHPAGGTVAGFAITTTIDRKDFGIVWNRTLDAGGMILGDDVEVSINLETKKQ